ncbi:FecR family protein [Chitinophaga niabensis]|uniref:Ferric-dicitrate binding protein FerR, regulates iron transport through sigma-19 n=1 Tax=Chitinophaga niabensis TaxID=536979 RepID=A0A1N6K602_9BACT|nr:FecR domain-containing protein [Chitinophaga niabensis]SIO51747.1 ferric-dicitrate binding protein FerR, regulates iron transport through sigma-19 [Chitinophaga niabensis]
MGILQPDEAIYSLLCKYLLNEADAVERQWVETWRKEDPANEEILSSIRRMLDALRPVGNIPGLDTESSWQRLKTTIGVEGPRVRKMHWGLKVAAVLVLALGIGLFFLKPAKEQVFAGAQQAELKDGSRVNMESNAEMHLVKGFGKAERRVHFTGKAHFDIAQNAEHPFVIVLGHTEIKVLGTRFMVDFKPQDSSLVVLVNSGKIMVTDLDKKDSVILTPGMLLRRDQQKEPFAVAENVQDLNRRQLVFSNVPLEKVIRTIEVVYGVEVEIVDAALLEKVVTANFENEPIDNVLATIAFITNTAVEKTAQGYSIK